MKQILQNLRTGELALREVPAPACPPGHVLVKTAYSFVSPGTRSPSSIEMIDWNDLAAKIDLLSAYMKG